MQGTSRSRYDIEVPGSKCLFINHIREGEFMSKITMV